MKKSLLAVLTFLTISIAGFAQDGPPQPLINRQTSLFEEYYKNKDYATSLRYGMWLAKNAPTFRKTLWEKLSNAYTEVGITQTDEALKSAFMDTVILVLNWGVQYRPDKAKAFILLKGFNFETYKNNPDSALASYKTAFAMGLDEVHFSYVLKAGRILVAKEMIGEAIELYSTSKDYYDSKGDSEASSALVAELNGVASPEELVEVNNKSLAIETDPAKKEKLLWQNLKIYDQNLKDDEKALATGKELEKLNPSADVYRSIGKSCLNLGKNGDAIEYFSKAAKKGKIKEDYLNIAQAYINLGKGSQARENAREALKMDKNTGKAYLLIGEAYQNAVEVCVNGKGGWAKLDFKDKCVYVLAAEYFNRGKAVDPMVTVEARNRIASLEASNLLPTKQDYFFQKLKAGDKVTISGNCYSWIGEMVVLP